MTKDDVVKEYSGSVMYHPDLVFPPIRHTYSRPPTLTDEDFVEAVDMVIKYTAKLGLTVLEMQHIFFVCTDRVLDFPIDADLTLTKRWSRQREQAQKER